MKHRFFVRLVKDKRAQDRINELFGDVEWVPEVVENELGFITPEITEKDMMDKKGLIDGFLGSIRVRF